VPGTKILIVGESVFKIHTHFKGFASYETGYCTMSLDPFIKRFAGTDLSIDFMPNHEVSLKFPLTIDELKPYDAVVISDAPADSFLLHPDSLAGAIMPNRLAMIGDYVRQGGGFAMIGGWMSFGGFHGKAHYSHSPLAKILPVTIEANDDRMETPEGVYPDLTQPDHSILKGLPKEWPDFLGYNRFAAKGGETLMRFRETGDPMLVVDTLGKGRLACFASDILPHWGSPRFQEWPHFETFWQNFFAWVGGKT